MSARSKIVNALVDKLKGINGNSPYTSNLFNNVYNKLVFWDEVKDFPAVYVTAGSETRDYLPGGFKWAYLNITLRIYVNEDETAQARLEEIFEDIETLLDANNELEYNDPSETTQTTELISILSISSDEGLLNPLGVGEMVILVQYDLQT